MTEQNIPLTLEQKAKIKAKLSIAKPPAEPTPTDPRNSAYVQQQLKKKIERVFENEKSMG